MPDVAVGAGGGGAESVCGCVAGVFDVATVYGVGDVCVCHGQ